ncbi:MAG: aminodeoxychorismate/anthranilate synthase component II [Ferruginibacter sp.]
MSTENKMITDNRDQKPPYGGGLEGPRILVFDNYDSFTYNLVHLVEKIMHTKVDVFRNDEITLEKVNDYDKIILSPGPGIPSEAGLLLPLIKQYAATKSILGVCLGHQAIGEAFGGTLTNLSKVYHGIATPIKIINTNAQILKGLGETIEVGRYHSWIISNDNFPAELEITATDDNGFVMALQHKMYDVQGVQFHPESVLTPDGEKILRNWLTTPSAH